jgi:hypothetical protein
MADAAFAVSRRETPRRSLRRRGDVSDERGEPALCPEPRAQRQ